MCYSIIFNLYKNTNFYPLSSSLRVWLYFEVETRYTKGYNIVSLFSILLYLQLFKYNEQVQQFSRSRHFETGDQKLGLLRFRLELVWDMILVYRATSTSLSTKTWRWQEQLCLRERTAGWNV